MNIKLTKMNKFRAIYFTYKIKRNLTELFWG